MPTWHRPSAGGPLARRRSDRFPAERGTVAAHRQLSDGPADGAPSEELARDRRLAWVEAVLLVADEPLTPRRLAAAAGLPDAAEARRLLRRLQALYRRDETAFQVEEIAGGFQLLTRAEFHPWLARLRRTASEMRLSAAARETLAVVAYRQPVMRADVEAVRGVQCGEVLRLLMEKGLVRLAGRHDSLGRPVLYATTKKFLQVFGLRSLKDLPSVEELRPAEKRQGPPPGGG